jgi:DNA mismatch endonuclease, patch repair protein
MAARRKKTDLPASRDRLTPEQRSWNMSRIRSTGTVPEQIVRRLLTSLGARYRLHRRDLPGKPDIVMAGRRRIIFVHGCFWHQHPGCREATMPTGNRAFWQQKLEANTARDARHLRALRRDHWRVSVIWECETRHPDKLLRRLARLLQES